MNKLTRLILIIIAIVVAVGIAALIIVGPTNVFSHSNSAQLTVTTTYLLEDEQEILEQNIINELKALGMSNYVIQPTFDGSDIHRGYVITLFSLNQTQIDGLAAINEIEGIVKVYYGDVLNVNLNNAVLLALVAFFAFLAVELLYNIIFNHKFIGVKPALTALASSLLVLLGTFSVFSIIALLGIKAGINILGAMLAVLAFTVFSHVYLLSKTRRYGAKENFSGAAAAARADFRLPLFAGLVMLCIGCVTFVAFGTAQIFSFVITLVAGLCISTVISYHVLLPLCAKFSEPQKS